MAHEVESMMLVGKPAWHGLGTVIGDPIYDADEIIKLAGQDWRVLESPVLRRNMFNDALATVVPGYKVLYREDTGDSLAVVTNEYKVFQNRDMQASIQRMLDSSLLDIETAGVLRGGKRCFVLYKVKGGLLELGRDDHAELYVLQTWGHDGKFGHHTQFTAVRVVCMNTMRAALAGQEQHIRIPHRAGIHEAVEAVAESVLLGKERFEEVAVAYRDMMNRSCSLTNFVDYVRGVLQVPEDKDITEVRAYPSLLDAFLTGPGSDLASARNTYWGAFNAVTHWIDHERGRSDENRLLSTWFGEGATLRNRAFDLALAA